MIGQVQVTRDDAERALLEAVEWLGRLPDRDRAFLSAGSRSCWPEVIRTVEDRQRIVVGPDGKITVADNEEVQVIASPGLSRRQMQRLHRLLLDPDCAAMAVPEGHRSLVGRVLVMMNWPGGDEFGWSRVWVAEGGRSTGVTSDCLRKRFDRALGRVAARMELLGLGIGET